MSVLAITLKTPEDIAKKEKILIKNKVTGEYLHVGIVYIKGKQVRLFLESVDDTQFQITRVPDTFENRTYTKRKS